MSQAEKSNQQNNQQIEKNPQRLKVLERITEYEKKGWWSKDVEDDPPTIPLTPDKVDYLNKKLSNKLATFFGNLDFCWQSAKLVHAYFQFIKIVISNSNLQLIDQSRLLFQQCLKFSCRNKSLKLLFHGHTLLVCVI